MHNNLEFLKNSRLLSKKHFFLLIDTLCAINNIRVRNVNENPSFECLSPRQLVFSQSYPALIVLESSSLFVSFVLRWFPQLSPKSFGYFWKFGRLSYFIGLTSPEPPLYDERVVPQLPAHFFFYIFRITSQFLSM